MATETIIIIIFSLSLLSASTTSASATSATEALNHHGGYSIAASALSSLSSSPSLYNATGTLLVPPDSSLSLLRPRPPSLSLLLSHTFPSLPPPPSSFRIVHPDLYRDAGFSVHGIDRVLPGTDPTEEIRSRLLDWTVRVLRRKGYGVASIGLSVRKHDLLRLDDVTLFATSDKALFTGRDGFVYDFLCHVAPRRYSPEDIGRMGRVETLSRRTVTFGPADEGFSEVYRNRWIVVIGVSRPLRYDDVAGGSCGGVYGEEDHGSCDDVEGSGALVSEKVESAPSHEVNGEPLDGRVLEESTVEMVRRKVRELSGVGRNRVGRMVVPFQVADDLFYYT